MPDPTIHDIYSVEYTFVSVGAVSTLIRAANLRRAECDIVNDGDEPVYLARGAAAVLNSGMRLNPQGGSYRIGTNNLWKGTIYGICAGGDVNVTVSEGSVR